MAEIRIIKTYDEFLSEVRTLHEEIVSAVQQRQEEYSSIGWSEPKRIRFEELDLRRWMMRMLSVHKTLQWRGHNSDLSRRGSVEDGRKARVVAIAGICELIKEEFVGKFWDAYKRFVGWGCDSTVYDWIWEQGFREQGINLVRSDYRREFVQTLVLESGVPKNRVRDIVDFFVIYWRHLTEYEDVEKVISDVTAGDQPLSGISLADRKRLKEICFNAADFSKAFARAIRKLIRIFDFIEKSADILCGDIDQYVSVIFRETGINPLEVLRDEDQLKKLYGLILGIITPQKLALILKGKPAGTRIRTPDSKTIRVEMYEHLQYGTHVVDNLTFTCVPNVRLQFSDFVRFPLNEVLDVGTGFLLKSRSRIYPVINGRDRPDLVHKLYIPQFDSFVFYVESQPAMVLQLSTEDGVVDAKITASEGFELSPFLHYRGNFTKKLHFLSVMVPCFRMISADCANSVVALVSDSTSEPLATITVNSDGYGYCSERSLAIKEPRPGPIVLKAAEKDTMNPVVINRRLVSSDCHLTKAMLFSPYYGREFRPSATRANRYGGKKFVIFTSGDGVLDLQNLKDVDISKQGSYSIHTLAWEDTSCPCEVRFETASERFCWKFEKCLHFSLSARKIHTSTLHHIDFGPFQGTALSDFEVVVSPSPPEDIKEKLIWWVSYNDASPQSIPFAKGPTGTEDGPSIRFSGAALETVASLAGYQINQNARIDISLGLEDYIFSSVTLWSFPDLQVVITPEEPVIGSEIYADVRTGGTTVTRIPLKDRRGRSKMTSPCRYEDGRWHRIDHHFHGKLELEEYGVSFQITAAPTLSGAWLGDVQTGILSPLRDLSQKELPSLDLLVFSTDGKPCLAINEEDSAVEPVCLDGMFQFCLALLPGLRRRVNSVKCIINGLAFTIGVNFMPEILGVHFDDELHNGIIRGTLSVNAPVGTQIIVEAYGNQDNVVGSTVIGCSGVEEDLVIEIPLLMHPHESGNDFRIFLYLDEGGEMRTPIGSAWTVRVPAGSKPFDMQHLRRLIAEACTSKKYFLAAKHVTVAVKTCSDDEIEELLEIENKIRGEILRLQMGSIANQALNVLKKEFLLDQ